MFSFDFEFNLRLVLVGENGSYAFFFDLDSGKWNLSITESRTEHLLFLDIYVYFTSYPLLAM